MDQQTATALIDALRSSTEQQKFVTDIFTQALPPALVVLCAVFGLRLGVLAGGGWR